MQPGVDEKETEGLFRQQTLKAAEILGNNPWCDQKKLAMMIAKSLAKQPEDILKSPSDFQAEQDAQAQAHQAEIEAKKKPPALDFAAIKLELLPLPMQALVIYAAMKQNGIEPPPGFDMNSLGGQMGGAVPPNTSGAPASPSMAGAPPNQNVMPPASINQAPPPNSAGQMPPSNPVNPASEMQGGSK